MLDTYNKMLTDPSAEPWEWDEEAVMTCIKLINPKEFESVFNSLRQAYKAKDMKNFACGVWMFYELLKIER